MLTKKTSERGPAPGAGSLVQTCSGRKTAGDRFFKRKKSTWKQVLNACFHVLFVLLLLL